MGVYIWGRLPAEYQEVEYIQSTNTNPNYGGSSWSGQYINTGFYFTPNSEISIDIQYNNTGSQQTFYGSYTTNTSYSSIRGYINGAKQWSRGIKNGEWDYKSTDISADTQRHTFVLNNSGFTVYTGSNIIYSGANQNTITKNGQYPVFLLADSDYGTITHYSGAKLYGCKIHDNGTLARDFVPCYRKSDNVIGLYDLVNNQFYTNSGSGTFSKGSDVNNYYEKEMKNAYIGEVLECDFTKSDYGFVYNAKTTGGSITYGRNNNGLYVYESINNGLEGVAWRVPDNIFNRGPVKKIDITVKRTAGYSLGVGLCTGIQDHRFRFIRNQLSAVWNVGSSDRVDVVTALTSANTEYIYTVDLENKKMYMSNSSTQIILPDIQITNFYTDRTAKVVNIAGYVNTTSGGASYTYIPKAIFYF